MFLGSVGDSRFKKYLYTDEAPSLVYKYHVTTDVLL